MEKTNEKEHRYFFHHCGKDECNSTDLNYVIKKAKEKVIQEGSIAFICKEIGTVKTKNVQSIVTNIYSS